MKRSNHTGKRTILYLIIAVVALMPAAGSARCHCARNICWFSFTSRQGSRSVVSSAVLAEPAVIGSAKAEGQQEIKQPARSRIAIIVDDFGNDMRGTEEMLEL